MQCQTQANTSQLNIKLSRIFMRRRHAHNDSIVLHECLVFDNISSRFQTVPTEQCKKEEIRLSHSSNLVFQYWFVKCRLNLIHVEIYASRPTENFKVKSQKKLFHSNSDSLKFHLENAAYCRFAVEVDWPVITIA